jgi:competence protein ComEC
MGFGGGATLAGLALEPLGQVLAWGAYPWLTWTVRVVEWTAGFPYATVAFKLSDLGLVAIYGAIAGVTALALLSREQWRGLWQRVSDRFPLKAALGGTALVTAVAWFAVLQLPDGRLKVAFLDVGQGDAIFVQTPGGVQILVDGGPEGTALLSELGRQMPFWDRTLDLVVLTHPDQDHLTGLIAALERYQVQAVIAREPPIQSDTVAAWQTALEAEGVHVIRGEKGTRIEISDGVTLELLHPDPAAVPADAGNTNNDSLVMRVTYDEMAVLLPGDIEAGVEQELVRAGAYLRSTVLKVPHHGSDTSTCQAFLDAVSAQVVVISVGAGNTYKLPAEEVMRRLGEIPLVYRTDQHGTVSISSDGHRLWVQTER